jgi:spore germination protein GerM
MRDLSTGARAAGACIVVVATLAGCGIPKDEAPRPVPPEAVDPRLLGRAEPSATPTPSGSGALQVAFVTGDDTVVLVRRPVSSSPVPRQAQELLTALTGGPDAAELSDGLSTAVPADVALRVASVDAGVAVVVLEDASPDAGQRRLPLAVAQVVLTLTSHPAIAAVRFTSGGEPVEAPLPGGEAVKRPLTAADYRSLLATGSRPQPTLSPSAS